MQFFLFILVNAALFIRPGEIVPPLAGTPVYQICLLVCLAVSLPKLLTQWTSQPWAERPVSLCMLGLLAAVICSHLVRFETGLARWYGLDFARVVLYYFLLVGIVDSSARLRQFLIWILILIVAMCSLAVLQYKGVINIPSLKVLERMEEDPLTGDLVPILQLVGTGIFNDPNDLCIIISLGILIGFYLAADRRYGLLRLIWVPPIALLGYALILTQSRGGLLALVAGLLILLTSRIGTRRAIVLAAVGLPAALPLLGGRLAKISLSADTAQERIHLWQEALALFRTSPLFGIGVNTLADEIGLVAHNSYVQSYAEMGFFGGTSFVGTFFLAAWMLHRKGKRGGKVVDPELRRMRPYLLAIVVCYAIGLYALTRCYVISTYLPVGLAEVYQRVAVTDPPTLPLRLNRRVLVSLVVVSMAALLGLTLFVRIFIR